MCFSKIFLYNQLIEPITLWKNFKNKRWNSPAAIRFGSRGFTFWTIPFLEDLINGFELLHGEIKGCCNEVELMNYFIS